MWQALFNQKGGVTKSSVAENLAAAGAKAGLKSLLVGFDVQGNSTDYVMGEPSEPRPGVEDFFKTNYCCVQESQSRL